VVSGVRLNHNYAKRYHGKAQLSMQHLVNNKHCEHTKMCKQALNCVSVILNDAQQRGYKFRYENIFFHGKISFGPTNTKIAEYFCRNK